jgi:hypothetical protein
MPPLSSEAYLPSAGGHCASEEAELRLMRHKKAGFALPISGTSTRHE